MPITGFDAAFAAVTRASRKQADEGGPCALPTGVGAELSNHA
jgi:hypothetical protein